MPMGYRKSSHCLKLPLESAARGSFWEPVSYRRVMAMALALLMGLLLFFIPAQVTAAGLSLPQRLIVIDPGHGGNDTGFKGPNERAEKTVTLQLAMDLARKLKSRERNDRFQIILTRDRDLDVDLLRRTAVANHHRADLLISLHWTRGTEGSATDLTLFVHAPPNADRWSPTGPTDKIPAEDLTPPVWSMVQTPHLPRSRKAALSIASAVNNRFPGCECRIREAPMAVLQGADMPALLIEIAQLNSPPDGTDLAPEQTVDIILEAIAEGISTFFTSH